MFEDDNLDDLDIGLGLEDLRFTRYGSLTKTESLTYFLCWKLWHYFHNLDIILQHSDIDVEIIGDIICPTSEEYLVFASTAC